MLFVNLVSSQNIFLGLSQLDARQSGRIGGYAFCYYGMTTTLAVATGIALVLIIHPGDPSIRTHHTDIKPTEHKNVTAVDKILDLIR